MTDIIPTEQTWVSYDVVSSSTGPFAFTFKNFGKDDLELLLDDVVADPSDWTFTPGAADTYSGYIGGSASMVLAVENVNVKVARKTQANRATNLTGAQLTASAINVRLNKHSMVLQELQRDIARALLAVYGSAGTALTPADVTAIAAIVADISIVADIDAEVLIAAGIADEIVAVSALDAGDLAAIAAGLDAKADKASSAIVVADYAAMKALTTAQLAAYTDVFVRDDKRGGVFEIITDTSGNVTAALAADTSEGLAVELTNGGGTKYAKRVYDGHHVYPEWFGADRDGTDDSTAIQAAIDWLVASFDGGRVALAHGQYGIGSEVTVYRGIEIVGMGMGDASDTTFPNAATELLGLSASGAVLRVTEWGAALRDFTVDADATRQAGTTAAANCGIRIEAPDLAGGLYATNDCLYERVQVLNQPGRGWLFVGAGPRSVFNQCHARLNGSNGFQIDRGIVVSRTNDVEPGIITMNSCSSTRNGGHAWAVGNPADTGIPSYRVILNEPETFYNCSDAGELFTDDEIYFRSETSAINYAAVGGAADISNQGDHGGLYVAGRAVEVLKIRLIQCAESPITVGAPATGRSTDGIDIDVGWVSSYEPDPIGAPGSFYTYTDLIDRETNAENVTARCRSKPNNFTNLISSNTGDGDDIHNDDFRRFNGAFQPDRIDYIRSKDGLTLADDAAAYIDFGLRVTGKAIIVSSGTTGGYAEVWFRAGTSAFCTKLIESGVTVGVGTAALAGTTGADGQLNVAATTANRIYIENRTAAARSYTITFIGFDTEPIGQIPAWVTV